MISTFTTLVDRLGFPKGTKVTLEDDKPERNTGKSGARQYTTPNGGALFYSDAEVEKVE